MSRRAAQAALLAVTAALLTPLAAAATPAGTPAGPASGTASGQGGTGRLEVVVDSSGSMAADDPSGGTRIEAARTALRGVVDALPDDAVVGVRAYGGTYEDQERRCTDTRLVVPVGRLDRAAARAAVDGLRPQGYTPIALSLQAAADDLQGEGPRTVLLVSDGEETCGGDPCEVARGLERSGVDVRVDTVGYAPDDATRAQLQCVADATGGEYFEAPDGAALGRELARLSARAFREYRPSGEPVTGGLDRPGAPTLEPGTAYLDSLPADTPLFYAVDLPEGTTPYVAATLAPDSDGARLDTSDRGFLALEVAVLTEGGQTCGTAYGRGDQTLAAMPVTAVAVPGVVGAVWDRFDDYQECSEPGRYYVTVTSTDRPAGEPAQPLELRLLLEPPLASLAGLPQASTQDSGQPAVEGPERAVVALGASFVEAPVLEPGTYRTDLKPGETLFARVPVGWGQSLSYRAEVPAGSSPTTASGAVDSEVYDPARVPVRAAGSAYGPLGGPSAVVVGDALPPVRYRNRESADVDRTAHTSLAGDYTVSFTLGQQRGTLPDVPLVLTLAVTGEVTGVPDYGALPAEAEAPSGTGTAPDGGEPGDDAASGGGAADGSRGLRPVAYVAGGSVAALLAGALLLAPWLRRRRP